MAEPAAASQAAGAGSKGAAGVRWPPPRPAAAAAVSRNRSNREIQKVSALRHLELARISSI